MHAGSRHLLQHAEERLEREREASGAPAHPPAGMSPGSQRILQRRQAAAAVPTDLAEGQPHPLGRAAHAEAGRAASAEGHAAPSGTAPGRQLRPCSARAAVASTISRGLAGIMSLAGLPCDVAGSDAAADDSSSDAGTTVVHSVEGLAAAGGPEVACASSRPASPARTAGSQREAPVPDHCTFQPAITGRASARPARSPEQMHAEWAARQQRLVSRPWMPGEAGGVSCSKPAGAVEHGCFRCCHCSESPAVCHLPLLRSLPCTCASSPPFLAAPGVPPLASTRAGAAAQAGRGGCSGGLHLCPGHRPTPRPEQQVCLGPAQAQQAGGHPRQGRRWRCCVATRCRSPASLPRGAGPACSGTCFDWRCLHICLPHATSALLGRAWTLTWRRCGAAALPGRRRRRTAPGRARCTHARTLPACPPRLDISAALLPGLACPSPPGPALPWPHFQEASARGAPQVADCTQTWI